MEAPALGRVGSVSRGARDWRKAKHKTRPHGRAGKSETMAKHDAIFCAACRNMILVPVQFDGMGNPIRIAPGDPWRKTEHVTTTTKWTAWFCSVDCHDKGEALPARDPAPPAHIDWARGQEVSVERARGRADALLGFDCIGSRPDYVKGHAEGMAMRAMLIEAVKQFEAANKFEALKS